MWDAIGQADPVTAASDRLETARRVLTVGQIVHVDWSLAGSQPSVTRSCAGPSGSFRA